MDLSNMLVVIIILVLVIANILLVISLTHSIQEKKTLLLMIRSSEQNCKFYEDRRNKEAMIYQKELDFLKEEELEKFNANPKSDLCRNKLKLKSTFKGKKLLLGDYNKEMLKHSRKIFMSLGFDVDIVQSGDDLLGRLRSTIADYDVVVTNFQYKDSCSGLEVLETIKSWDNYNVPVVVLTVSTNQRDTFIQEYGFDGYLEKVLTQEQAEEVMTELLLNKELNS